MKFFLVLSALFFSLFSNAQFNTGEYVAGNGLTTYSEQDPLNNNFYLPEANCGTVTRFTRFQNGQIKSLPNNASCSWAFLDGNGTVVHFVSRNSWNSAPGTSYNIPGSNIKLTINAINSTFIELLIERLNPTNCNTGVIGLNYVYSGFGTYLNPLQHTCSDCVPNNCPSISTQIRSCDGLNCIKLTKPNFYPISCPKCFCVKVTFSDGSTSSFDASFSHGNKVMHCYDKPISNYTLTAKPESECNECSSGGIVIFGQRKKSIINQPLKIYPNPTGNVFKIENTSDRKITNVKIFDIKGKQIKNFTFSEDYSINDLQNGVYLVKIFEGDKEISTMRLIKK